VEAAEAGMLNLAAGALQVNPDAPFAGWKASGIGPPEHGIWDREFYARPQAVYGDGA
jgi:acyl-CoA reductase-like NAD-dependent aldehyde dehydrogenase